METAKILANRLDVKKDRMILSEHLATTGNAKQLIDEIKGKYKDVENIALVGHEPNLSSLISLLFCGDANGSLILKKGGVCFLSTDALEYGKCATLHWLSSPAQLIHIGENS